LLCVTVDFAFGLQPIIEFFASEAAAFEIDFIARSLISSQLGVQFPEVLFK